MSQWYFSTDGAKQSGPHSKEEIGSLSRANPGGFVWREGFTGWLPAAKIGELAEAPAAPAPPPLTGTTAHEIDFRIFGEEMQFVEVELDPGESTVAEAGSMMYKDTAVEMETLFGDGSGAGEGKLMDKLLGAGKRIITGESLFMTVFTHRGTGKARVAFGAPYPGSIIPVSLPTVGGRLICQKDSFLCAARGVEIGIYFQRKIMTGLFGGEGFIMQKLEGDGMVFVHAGGCVVERELKAGESFQVDTGCVVAFQDGVGFEIEQVGGIKSMVFGGEGAFFARLSGPGKIWLQSLPFSRLAGRMLAAAPKGGGKRTGEGSILGGLGDIIGGDR
jgi:uncharacterized protein (TIGR00266 family)